MPAATITTLPGRIFAFYRDGFAAMQQGRTLWAIIAVKLFFIFAILRVFFFPDLLAARFATDQERAAYVLEELTGAQALIHPVHD
ncbi:MAG: DUF4492 domain-containing protein [Thermodesulfobacteriota bacterium]